MIYVSGNYMGVNYECEANDNGSYRLTIDGYPPVTLQGMADMLKVKETAIEIVKWHLSKRANIVGENESA